MRGRWYRRYDVMAVETVTILAAAAFLAFVGWATVAVVRREPIAALSDRCQAASTECGVVSGFLFTVATVILIATTFIVWRVRAAKRPIRRKAKGAARDYVPTAANSILDEVVGRDELCNAINDELRHRSTRRPHLLVGGIGSGKTAVMVRLTELLARRQAVPIPVRLRDVDGDELDFADLARHRFCREVDEALLGRGLAAKALGQEAWRRLRKQDRVVVLADGLEEVFAGKPKEADRDNLIRRAIRAADEQRLPLVIASRPHAPLRDVDAAVIELEPLSEEAALTYIEAGMRAEDEHRLDWIVEGADVTAEPLYLQVANELYHADRLERVVGRVEPDKLNTRNADRSGLRQRLLETWTDALVDGHLRPELALTRVERRMAVEQVSALACIGLQQDTLEVQLDELLDADGRSNYPRILDELRSRLTRLGGGAASSAPAAGDGDGDGDGERERSTAPGRRPRGRVNLPLAATWGEQLRLVEAHGDRVRFQHSLMQAHLGSRYLDTALREEDRFLDRALRGRLAHDRPAQTAATHGHGPSREFLTSLVFRSRAGESQFRDVDGDGSGRTRGCAYAAQLQVKAPTLAAEKALDLYTAALEIDSACGRRLHRHIMDELVREWPTLTSQDKQGFADAKLHLLRRVGEELRSVANAPRDGADARPATSTGAGRRGQTPVQVTPREVQESYCALFDIACREPSYSVRLAIADEIGNGGDDAFAALRPALEQVWRLDGDRALPATARELWAGARRREPATEPIEIVQAVWLQERWAWTTTTRTRPTRRAQLARPVAPARRAGRAEVEEKADEALRATREERWGAVCAWLAPMLVGSVQDERRRAEAKRVLTSYVERVRTGAADLDRGPGAGSAIALQIALSHGFKSVANQRMRHFATTPEGRVILHEQAEELLKVSDFWFAHLSLIQALTLWALPDSIHLAAPPPRRGGPRSRSPRNRVNHWLAIAGKDTAAVRYQAEAHPASKRRAADWHSAGIWTVYRAKRRLHPFVRQTGELAIRALKTGHPERFLWIHATGMTNKVGSVRTDPRQPRIHNLWIPPSTGWTALDDRALQLVADVLILLNLTERGEPADRERYLRRANRKDLPPCITGDRRPMQPDLSVARPGVTDPGSSCADGCPFELCPYPPRGTPEREEMGEAFCRRQLTLLASWRRRAYARPSWLNRSAAPWQRANLWSYLALRAPKQDTVLHNLKRFWSDMADRRLVKRPGRDV